MGIRYTTPGENRAYMDGYTRARQAGGLDWAELRIRVEAARDTVRDRLAEKDREIRRLRAELAAQREEYEGRILDLESQIEAHKIAWRHRREEA